MKVRRTMFAAVVTVAVAVGLGACSSSKPANTVNPPGAGSNTTAPPSTNPPSGGGVSY